MASRFVFPCTTLYVLLVTLVLSIYLLLAFAQRSEEEKPIMCPYNDKGCLKYLNEFAMEHINNHFEVAIASLEKEFQDKHISRYGIHLTQKPYMHMTYFFPF